MATWNEVKDNPNYIKVLDHGFVGLVDHMGSDSAIAEAARVSYGKGTKTVNKDRGLIRYLVKHRHTSPIEMGELKFHIKCPIFVMRNLVRHRTASLNEVSARYSILPDEFYSPELSDIQHQSKSNNQGREGEFPLEEAKEYKDMIQSSCEDSYKVYENLLGTEEDPKVAREISRSVLPLGIYTELVWKQDLKNLLHLIRLRADSHAQYEIQKLAEAMYQLIQPLFPATIEAFEDYDRQSISVSRMEKDLLKKMFALSGTLEERLNIITSDYATEKDFLLDYGITKRELGDFISNWKDIIV